MEMTTVVNSKLRTDKLCFIKGMVWFHVCGNSSFLVPDLFVIENSLSGLSQVGDAALYNSLF